MQTAIIQKNFDTIEELPGQLRLCAAAGMTSILLNPDMAIQLAHDLDEGRKLEALRADIKTARAAADDAIEAAKAALQPIQSAAATLPKIVARSALQGAILGGVAVLIALDSFGLITW